MLDRSLGTRWNLSKSTVAVAEAAGGSGGPVYASPHDVTLHAPQPEPNSWPVSIGFGDGQIVEVKPAAAELLRPWLPDPKGCARLAGTGLMAACAS